MLDMMTLTMTLGVVVGSVVVMNMLFLAHFVSQFAYHLSFLDQSGSVFEACTITPSHFEAAVL